MYSNDFSTSKIGNNRFTKPELLLFLSLMIIAFIPSINDLIVVRLLSAMDSELINIAGQIEWFDTINETILAFLIMPLYYLLNKVIKNTETFKNRISQSLTIGFLLYIIFSIIILIYANTLTSIMTAPEESTLYLRLETIGFIIGFLVSFLIAVFVVIGKWKYFVLFILSKCIILTLGNLMLVPELGVNGVAITNIIANVVLATVGMFILHYNGLLQRKPRFEKKTLREWWNVGKYSGGQIFLSNLIYVLIIGIMINAVSEAGNYWIANSFIWGWLLIPVLALSEIIKRDYDKGITRLKQYFVIMGIIVIIWVVSMPSWGFMFENVFHVQEPDVVLNLVYTLIPFYIVFTVSVVFDSIFLAIGKTVNLFITSLIVNTVYYGIVYGLFVLGYFEPTLEFIMMMFGFGIVFHTIISMLLYYRMLKRNKEKDFIVVS